MNTLIRRRPWSLEETEDKTKADKPDVDELDDDP